MPALRDATLPLWVLAACLAALLSGCGGSGKPGPADPKNVQRQTSPATLVLGQGAGMTVGAAGGFQVTGSLGAPIVQPVSSATDTLHPGLMPQTTTQ